MTAANIELPPVTEYQRDAIFCAERNAVIEATTKAGKTVGCIYWLLSEAANTGARGREYWWIAPVFPQSRIAFRRMKQSLTTADPERRWWTANEAEMRIELRNGAAMMFKSGDHPDTLYGDDVYAAVLDEASRMKEAAWHAVRSTLTATRGRARIIGNVRGRKNWAWQLARKVESGSLPGWRYAKITCYDAVKAGIIDAAEVDAARRELPEPVFRELYEGVASEDGSNPFGMSAIAACIAPMSANAPAAWGVDLAKSHDWTVAVGLDAAGAVCRCERWQGPWKETERRLIGLIGSTPAAVDSTGVGDPIVEALQLACPSIEGKRFTQQSKQQLMMGLAAAIQRGDITFPDGPIVAELEAFEYEYTATGVRYSAPAGMHDDCVCAIALAVHCKGQHPAVTVSVGGPRIARFTPARSFADARQDSEWGWR